MNSLIPINKEHPSYNKNKRTIHLTDHSKTKKQFIRFVHISDTHNKFFQLPAQPFSSDEPEDEDEIIVATTVCVMSGDFCCHGTQKEHESYHQYIRSEIATKCQILLQVGGNHCFCEDHYNNNESKILFDKEFISGVFFGENDQHVKILSESEYRRNGSSYCDLLSLLEEKEKRQLANSKIDENKLLCVLLHDRIVTIGGIRIAGAPWMTMGSWSDVVGADVNRRFEIYYNLISKGNCVKSWDVTKRNFPDKEGEFSLLSFEQDDDEKKLPSSSPHVLISHVPPFQILDQAGIMPCGCRGLRKALMKWTLEKHVVDEDENNKNDRHQENNLVLHCFGHAHGQFGILEKNMSELFAPATGMRPKRQKEDSDCVVDAKKEDRKSKSIIFSNGALDLYEGEKYFGPNVFDLEKLS